MKKAAINGFGRFGMHLLQYWIENYENALFEIIGINDDTLSIEDVQRIVTNDPLLNLKNCVDYREDAISVMIGKTEIIIPYSTESLENIPWIGEPELLLECSGKHANRSDWDKELVDKTRVVIVSATSWTADQILVYGYNHQEFANNAAKVISYGSCTVNAYVPLAQWVHDTWGVIDSDVSVIHNVPVHKKNSFDTLERRVCTLEQVAPHLLDFLTEDNFAVTYTLVPYIGVSMIDFRFRLAHVIPRQELITRLTEAINSGGLRKLYSVTTTDKGPAEHKFTRNSAVLVESNIKVVGDNVYIGAYFDNENSVNRYFDIVNYAVLAGND